MPALETKLNARSADFQANAAAMRALVDDLGEKVAKSAAGGGDTARAKHVKRGKLLPRDRVQMLLDPGTPFLELSPLAGYAMYPDRDGSDSAPCAGVITGIGRVNGIDCMVVCNDATVKGGTYYPMTVGEHVVLIRQIGAARIDQVHTRQVVLLRDLLCAQVLFDRHRVIGEIGRAHV